MSEPENFFDMLVRKLTITDEDFGAVDQNQRINDGSPIPESQLTQCFKKATKEILEPDVLRKIEERAMGYLKRKEGTLDP
jgi:hypothetical protein